METRLPKNVRIESLSEKMKVFLSFVNLVENSITDLNAYEVLLHPEVSFYEYPNLITKNGQVRDFEVALKGIEFSRNLLEKQAYEYLDWFETEEKLVVESIWTGTLAMDAGNLRKGEELRGHICTIVDFKNGKIIRQRNYDCYEPF